MPRSGAEGLDSEARLDSLIDVTPESGPDRPPGVPGGHPGCRVGGGPAPQIFESGPIRVDLYPSPMLGPISRGSTCRGFRDLSFRDFTPPPHPPSPAYPPPIA